MSKTEVTEAPTPVSPLYEVQGKQVRQYTNGWHCTCGGAPDAECEHIAEAKELHKAAKSAAKEESQ